MPRNALVTGATGGLGMETARQMGSQEDLGYTHVILSGRSQAKADAAVRLVAETVPTRGEGFFSGVALDLNSPESVQAAVADLAGRGQLLHALVFNAGYVPSERVLTDEDIEYSMAATVIGHHRLLAGLLQANVLAPDCRIVFSGSEVRPTTTIVRAFMHFN